MRNVSSDSGFCISICCCWDWDFFGIRPVSCFNFFTSGAVSVGLFLLSVLLLSFASFDFLRSLTSLDCSESFLANFSLVFSSFLTFSTLLPFLTSLGAFSASFFTSLVGDSSGGISFLMAFSGDLLSF